MSTRFMRMAVLAVPVLLAAACAGEETDELGTDATMPADTGMYVPPPMPMDTGMMGTDTMGRDTMGMDTMRTP